MMRSIVCVSTRMLLSKEPCVACLLTGRQHLRFGHDVEERVIAGPGPDALPLLHLSEFALVPLIAVSRVLRQLRALHAEQRLLADVFERPGHEIEQ